MYQVLQVYTSFSFFDNFLSMSMKVGQSSSRKRRRNVSETNWRFEKVSKESQKKSNMFDFTATPSRPAKSPGDVAATSPRPTETRVAHRSLTSLHASEIGALRRVSKKCAELFL